jgi:2-amino-4-hydroxy-6-hydroxymethyldihydropteridine diphosphokinase
MSGVAYIGVGSNIDAYENCLRGVRNIVEDERVEFMALSSFYRTSPVSPIAQDDFINCAVKIGWSAWPFDLLSFLGAVELKMARVRHIPSGPRSLDLDILLFDDLLLETPELSIPHPRMHERKFTLVPCLEIDPDLVHPRLARPLAQFLDSIGDEQRIELVRMVSIEETYLAGTDVQRSPAPRMGSVAETGPKEGRDR